MSVYTIFILLVILRMHGTQCNDIISNIVFIRMFFTLFSNRIISFFYPLVWIVHKLQCFKKCQHCVRTDSGSRGGEGGQPNVYKPGQGKGGPKNSQTCADILYGWPLKRMAINWPCSSSLQQRYFTKEIYKVGLKLLWW